MGIVNILFGRPLASSEDPGQRITPGGIPTFGLDALSSDWVFEIKWDGFRSLAYIEMGACRLVSRNGNEFKLFPDLNEALAAELRAQSAVPDGEIYCLNRQGKSQFKDLFFHRGEPRFYAFDIRCLSHGVSSGPLHAVGFRSVRQSPRRAREAVRGLTASSR